MEVIHAEVQFTVKLLKLYHPMKPYAGLQNALVVHYMKRSKVHFFVTYLVIGMFSDLIAISMLYGSLQNTHQGTVPHHISST
jgi:hypothetical protein